MHVDVGDPSVSLWEEAGRGRSSTVLALRDPAMRALLPKALQDALPLLPFVVRLSLAGSGVHQKMYLEYLEQQFFDTAPVGTLPKATLIPKNLLGILPPFLSLSPEDDDALIMVDVFGGWRQTQGAICVEWKLKHSSIPHAFRGRSRDLRRYVCRYCIQHYPDRVSLGRSRYYCPLEVFSGDHRRAEGALRDLLLLWCENPSQKPKLPIQVWSGRGPTRQPFVDALRLLEAVPRLIDALYSSGAVRWSARIQDMSRVPIDVLSMNEGEILEEDNTAWGAAQCWGRQIVCESLIPPVTETCVAPAPREFRTDEGIEMHRTAFYRAQSVRDCSIAMVLYPEGEVSVRIVDLDNKSRKTLAHYATQDRELVAAFVRGHGLERNFNPV